MTLEVKTWNHRRIYYRPGTSDADMIEIILEKRQEYHLPKNISPRRIVDIGANIGITALLMAHEWPHAEIHCYEPDPQNFEILAMNTAPLPNVKIVQAALGEFSGSEFLYRSDNPTNFGGSSFFDLGTNAEDRLEVEVLNAAFEFERIGPVDLIKIDCEGAEEGILFSLDRKLHDVQYILGEAHGYDDFTMFKQLSDRFDLAIFKPMGVRCYPFYAKRRSDGRAL